MDSRCNVSLNRPKKPSKLLALFALIVAFMLPFFLVKIFHHYPQSHIAHIPVVLPDLDKSSDNHPLSTAVLKNAATPRVQLKNPPPVKLRCEWKIVKTSANDSLAAIFNRLQIDKSVLPQILKDNPRSTAFKRLPVSQELQLLVKGHSLEKMIIPINISQYIVVTRNGQHYPSQVQKHKSTTKNIFLTATVRSSLYNTAKRQNIPSKLIRQMTQILANEINFSKEVRSGDQFTLIYKASFIRDKLVSTGDIVAVSYKNRGKTFQAVQHISRNGHADYYNPQGNSLKKAFNRYPIRFSHISSTFSLSRYHPILHYRRSHKGIDLAARIGTPIKATGDGKIEMIGRQNGYGNVIRINHYNRFTTIYAHMLKFQKGLSRGSYVRRDQVIGYVGQTGMASGPHCHYEFRIKEQPKNPATIDLPRGNPVPAREKLAFKAHSATMLAQLKRFEEKHYAENHSVATTLHG